MRGLNIRADFATAKIHMLINADAANEEATCVIREAENQGFSDFVDGIYDVPLLFVGEPELVQAWNKGSCVAGERAATPSGLIGRMVRMSRRHRQSLLEHSK